LDETVYQPRALESFLKQANEQFPVLLVTGPRQVGKTTILQHLSRHSREYISLDDPGLAELARQEPTLFLQRFRPPLLIDEIQYAPQLLPVIKLVVDQQKKKGLFWLTGSQQFHLMQGVTESLAGRVGIVQLLGLSQLELNGQGRSVKPFLPTMNELKRRAKLAEPLTLKKLYERIWRGSFPALALRSRVDRDLFYSSYIQTYLQRDVRSLTKVGDEAAYLRFLRAVAARTGQLLNVAEMARDVGISPPTAHHWLSILQTSGLVYLLEPYFSNVTKRLVKAPKLYFLDTGLASYLTEWSSAATLEAGAMTGAILETFLFTEILKSYWHQGKRAPFYYYRDKDQKEIDLLIKQDDVFYPIEFKKTAAPSAMDVKHFSLVENLGQVGPGAVVCLAETHLPITDKVQAVPVGYL
jgi:uncharacterized protein